MRRLFPFLFLPAAVPAWAQSNAAAPAMPTPGSMMMQAVVGLIVVLGLLAGAAWLLRRINPVKAGQSGQVRIVGGVNVGSRERVIVVEVADQWIVVGVAPGSVNALSTLPRQELPASGTSAGTNGGKHFSSWLKQSIEQRNARP